jgi:hypothetical protein
MKYLFGLFIILGVFMGVLISCQSINNRNISSKQIFLEQETFSIIQNEVNILLDKTNDLKRFKVTRPKFF